MKKILAMLALAVVLIIPIVANAQTMICVVTKGEWVWVRNEPSPTAEKIDTIRWGYEVDVSEIVNQYAHITCANGADGWVDVSYLEKPIKETTYIVACNGPLNKRETPDGRFMGKIKSGVRISVLGWRYSKSGELWAKVYKGGYVNAKFLEEAN